MAGIGSAIGLLKALGRLSRRDVRSVGSVAGQNFFGFGIFVAYQQPASAEFFFVILAAILIFPLSSDPMQKIPADRRVTWPIGRWEWSIVRTGAFALSPIAWVAAALVVRAGWRMGVLVCGVGLVLQLIAFAAKRGSPGLPLYWLHWIPAPPGAAGAIMRLQWREMVRTLDPYLAFVLMACTELYKLSGKPLDPAAPRILALLVVLALSTETQVLFGIDGHGAERYRQLPIRGWRILLAKDLAFLVLLALLVLPLDWVSGLMGGLAALAIGHRRSVGRPIAQTPWRFTSGAIAPDGVLQIAAVFAVGLAVGTEGLWLICLCIAAWIASLLFYGWRWDRQA
ncbi:MAG TPA: hypothetical protein VF283_07875 [Bryobacteraceae bacterium]